MKKIIIFNNLIFLILNNYFIDFDEKTLFKKTTSMFNDAIVLFYIRV